MPYKDLDARRAYSRTWRARNRWKYTERTAYYDSAKHANERAARYGCVGTITWQDVRAILDGASCSYCGVFLTRAARTAPRRSAATIDHVVALEKGGRNTVENIVPSCHSCNASKGRADRPGRWARDYDACIECGTTDMPHLCHGACKRCYERNRSRQRRAS